MMYAPKDIQSILASGWEYEPLCVSEGISLEAIEKRGRIVQALASIEIASQFSTVGLWELELINENTLLRREIEEIRRRLAELEEKMPEENVIILREIPKEQAKQEIRQLFSTGRTLYYSDIAEELQLDLQFVVEICRELEEGGEVAVDDGV